jgi:hypothetical protein
MALLLAVVVAVGTAAATAQAAPAGYGPYPPSPSPPSSPPAPSSYTLSVTKTGAGAGLVTSSPGGISCGEDCEEAYAGGISVTLTAVADAGSSFAGWGGACTGIGSCTVSMDAAKSVTAAFAAGTQPPDSTVQGSIAGTKLVVRAGKRVVRLSLTLSEDVDARLRLVRGGRVLAAKRVALTAGRRLVALRIPAVVAGGPATLRIALEDAAGNTKTAVRSVRVPPA